jgi:tRNA(Ile2) C34 agmatinyltransferase TiaS
MAGSIVTRLERLEQTISAAADACPQCGANWPGAVYLSVDAAGRGTYRCIRCDHKRPDPGEIVKAYGAGMVEQL